MQARPGSGAFVNLTDGPNVASVLEQSGGIYRPATLGRLVGLSASQIRNYERSGFIPPAQRTATGYRVFDARHATALRVARCLQEGYGWQRALDAMHAVHHGDTDRAFAVVDERHADIHAQRRQVAEALEGLDHARQDVATVLGLRLPRGHTLSIGQAASALAVNASAIRYWESRDVLTPIRTADGRRRYDQRLLQRLQLIKLLRDINYGFDTIEAVVNDLSDQAGTKALRALEERQALVKAASFATARATHALIGYIAYLGLAAA